MTKKGRKLILVRSDLLEKVAQITAREGKTTFAFTNETFQNAIKAYDMQTSLEEILEVYSLLTLGRKLGITMLPTTLVDYMLNSLSKSHRKDLLDRAYESGTWFGKCLTIKLEETETLKTMENVIKKYMWDSLDLSITNENDTVELRCVSPTLSKEKTDVVFKFLEGTFNSLDYKIFKNSCLRGLILMKLKRSSDKIQQQSRVDG